MSCLAYNFVLFSLFWQYNPDFGRSFSIILGKAFLLPTFMKRARACWTTGEESSDNKRRLWQVKTNQSDASLRCLLLRLPSVEIPMACVEQPPIPQRGGGGVWGFWIKTNSFWVRCFDVINLCKVCFWLEFTHLKKKWLGLGPGGWVS